MKSLKGYINKNYSKLIEISKRLTSKKYPDYEDLLHETILELYKIDKEKIESIIKKKQLTFYIIRVMMNQYHSNTSPYYIKYKRYYRIGWDLKKKVKENRINDLYIYNKGIDYWKEVEKDMNWVERKLQEFTWFDSQVFRIYFMEGHSLNSMQEATKINRSTLGKSIRKVKRYLKEKINEEK